MSSSLSIYLLQSISFLDLLAIGLIVPLLPSHVRSLGGKYIAVALLGSIYAGFQFFSGPLIGSLSDLKGRRSILILSLVVCSLAYAFTGLTNSVIIILCLRGVLGLFKQTQMLTRAMVPEFVEDRSIQSEIFGKMAAISGAGITIGPVIGGHIVEGHPKHGLKYLSVAVGLCFLLNAALVYLIPEPCKTNVKPSRRKKGKRRQKSPPREEHSIVQFVWLSLKQSVVNLYYINWVEYWDVFMLKALIGFAMGVYYSNYNLYLSTIYQLTPKYVGYIISFQGIIGSVSSFFMGKLNSFYPNDNDYSLRNLHIFVIISAAFFGLIMLQNIYLYVFFLIPIAFGNAAGRLISLEMILTRTNSQSHRGSLIGASNSIRSLSGVVAPMATGVISQYVGVQYPVYASLFATILGICLSYYIRSCRVQNYNDDTDDDYEYETRNHKIKTE